MALHDAYLRKTPFELAFPDPEAARSVMDDIAREADGRGTPTGDPGAFVMLGAVGELLRELRGPETPADAIHDYAALVFHAFHFLRADAPALLAGTEVVRALVEGGPEGDAPVPPTPAGYLQLPRNLFWIQAGPDQAPEPVDGLFWTAAGGVLHVLLASGMHEGRPGLGVVPLPEAPLADAPSWLDADVRGDGRDFATTLPGGELEGLYSLTAAGEVFKLIARTFGYLARHPGSVEEGPPAGADAVPAPSVLPYRRITLAP